MRIIDYFNPFSSQFHALDEFKNLSGGQKILTIALTALVSLVSFGFGGVAVFRALVNRFQPLDLDADTPQSGTARKVDDARRSLLRKSPENMGDRTLTMRKYLTQELRKMGKVFFETEDSGDCLFDAVAQALTLLDGKEISMKEVRMACHEYIQKLDKEQPGNNWLEQAIGNTQNYDSLRKNIQYTAEELSPPIWGDVPIIKMISKVFDVKVVSHELSSFEIDDREDDFLGTLTKYHDEKRVVGHPVGKTVEQVVTDMIALRQDLDGLQGDEDEETLRARFHPTPRKRVVEKKVLAAEVLAELATVEYDEREHKSLNHRIIEIANYGSGPTGHFLGVRSA